MLAMSRLDKSAMPPAPGGNYHFNMENQASTNLAQNMQSQAMDFVNVLKVLIEDTVVQQRRISEDMFHNAPLPASYPYPQSTNLGQQPPTALQQPGQNYHFNNQAQIDVN